MKQQIIDRIGAFRAEMKKASVAAAIIPQTDPHLGEYIAAHWQVRRWLSGFTGSAGTLVITGEGSATLDRLAIFPFRQQNNSRAQASH